MLGKSIILKFNKKYKGSIWEQYSSWKDPEIWKITFIGILVWIFLTVGISFTIIMTGLCEKL